MEWLMMMIVMTRPNTALRPIGFECGTTPIVLDDLANWRSLDVVRSWQARLLVVYCSRDALRRLVRTFGFRVLATRVS